MCSALRGELDWSCCEVLNEFSFHVYISRNNFYESTVIQPRNIERLFAGGELHVLGCSEKSTAAAFGDTLVSLLLLAVSYDLHDKVQKGPSLLLLDLFAVHALTRGYQQEDESQYMPFLLHLHGFSIFS